MSRNMSEEISRFAYSDEIERYWRSSEALEPTFKFLGLRKRLNMARINSDLQSIAHCWLRRHQRKLIIMAKLREDYAMQYLPSCTIRPIPGCSCTPSSVLELFPRLCTLELIYSERIGNAITVIGQMGANFETRSKQKSSGFQAIDDMKYKHFMALMDSCPNLKTIKLTQLKERRADDTSMEIERECGLVSIRNIGFTMIMKDLENHKIRSDEWIPSMLGPSPDLKEYLTSGAMSALEHLGFDMNEDDPSDERIEWLSNAFKESTCDRLRSFTFYTSSYVDQVVVLILLSAISKRWPELKHLEITWSNTIWYLSEDQLCEIIGCFKNLETLKFRRIVWDAISNQSPFPPTETIEELTLAPFQPAISLLFPFLRNWSIPYVDATDLYRIATYEGELPCSNVKVLDMEAVSFFKDQDDSMVDIEDSLLGFRLLLRSFTKLKSLRVRSFELRERNHILRLCNIIIAECPYLEKLTLKNKAECQFEPLSFIKIISNLKYLEVAPWDLNRVGPFRYLLENSPKLRSLRISRESDIGYTKEIQSLIDMRSRKDPDFLIFD